MVRKNIGGLVPNYMALQLKRLHSSYVLLRCFNPEAIIHEVACQIQCFGCIKCKSLFLPICQTMITNTIYHLKLIPICDESEDQKEGNIFVDSSSYKILLTLPISQLSPWSTVFLKKLIISQLQVVKKYTLFHATWKFFTVFTRAPHRFLYFVRQIQPITPS